MTDWTVAGVEVTWDRGRTWVVLAGEDDGLVVVRALPPFQGAQTAAELADLARQHKLSAVAIDPKSPSSTLPEPLQGLGVPLLLADAVAMAMAHGTMADLLASGKLHASGHPALAEAARVAETRRVAGAAAVDRYVDGVDMAVLVACELSVWALAARRPFFAAWK